ncbi:hypothetical protein [Aquibacillus rhizosphaerae]|uniref:Uncharacterized protein n=1 Tax=Aquibacillus rhizosphaerae TaxID=3051431 RepID=A0ABT7LAG7_9BACI|nr:hypothetical protein [Aquibacillus sp. LR5S19]MDL4842242.1 hypothetical protein [Aquibacillus sp. LR5S19]
MQYWNPILFIWRIKTIADGIDIAAEQLRKQSGSKKLSDWKNSHLTTETTM